uniref:ORF013 n=1 Tax=Spodoptera frugiperda granulovirus TaxID=307454 RepID=A0A346QVT2_9BBAC|nr:ORF013 [Spodoptera frugiperda granulovirus]
MDDDDKRWSVVQETFFLHYFCALPDCLTKLPISVETVLILNLTTKALKKLQKDCADTFAVYEKYINLVRLKCYQVCVVMEKMGGVPYSHMIAEPYTQYNQDEQLNYDINCSVDLLLCTDLVKETVDNVIKLFDDVQQSKEYVYRLYQACTVSVHDCAVCRSTHTMLTACGHRFCYECFVKASSVKQECPVCRNTTNFRYIKDNTPDLLQTVRSYYEEHELTWVKK